MKKRILCAILCAMMLIGLCAAAEGGNFFLEAIGAEETEALPELELSAAEWMGVPETNDAAENWAAAPELNGVSEEWADAAESNAFPEEWAAAPELNGVSEEWADAAESNAVPEDWVGAADLNAAPEQAAKIEVCFTQATIYVGDKGLRLWTRFTDGREVNADGTAREIRYFTYDSSIATVSGNGTVTGKKKGSTVIVAASIIEGEVAIAECALKVVGKPSKVALTPDSPLVMVGSTIQLTPVFASGTGSSCAFSSSDESVATVDIFGVVTARKKGTCKIRVATYNGKYGYATVNVCTPITSFDFTEKEVTLYVNTSKQLALQLKDYEVDDFTVSVQQIGEVISVDGTGVVRGLSEGTATITLRTKVNGCTATCRVTVLPAPQKIIAPPSISIGKGEQVNLMDAGIVSFGTNAGFDLFTFSSSRTKYVTVNAKGTITAKAVGYSDILVRTQNGLSATIRVNVMKRASKITLSPKDLYMAAGTSDKIKITFPSGSFSGYMLQSDRPDLLTVDMDGSVQASADVNRAEVVQVHAATLSGLTDVCMVHINPAPTGISIGSVPQNMSVGEAFQIKPVLQPADAYNRVTCENSNPNAVLLTDDGYIIAIGAGRSNITVSTANGLTAGFWLDVLPYRDTHPYICIAHRGASGYYPENTLEAFQHAKELGADMVELDVRRSRDGVLVVQHNATVKRNGKNVQVSSLTYSELYSLNRNLCTLEEALNCLKAYDIDVQIELKETGIESDVMKTVYVCGVSDRVWYASFNISSLNAIRSLDPSARTIYIISNASEYRKVNENPMGYAFDVASISVDIITRDGCTRLHLGGKQVYAWTIDDDNACQRALESGVDGIVTDYPDYV